MKKIIKILCLIFVLVFITSCTVEEHEHEFGDEYKYDESKHWTECNVRGCKERNNEGKHDYTILDTTIVNGIYTITKKCYACDYVISEEFAYDLVVDTSEEWNYLFQTLELTNFSMNVYFKEEDTIIENYCKVTENGIEVNDEGDLTYSIRQSDGTFNTYEYYEYSGKWYLDDDTSDETYNSFIEEEARLSFKFVDEFDKFTYDLSTGVYKCKDGLIAVLDENGEFVQEFKLFNTEVVIVEGKVSSIKSDYGMEGELETASFEYYDIGNTVITFTEDMISNLVHDHRLTNEYSYDETKHWKECTVLGCNEKALEDSHHMSVSNSSLVDDIYYITKKCNICDYEVTEEHAYDSVVDTSEEWNVLFEAFKLTNFSLNVYFPDGDYIPDTMGIITEEGLKVIDEGDVLYSIKQNDGSYLTFERYEGEEEWDLEKNTSDEIYRRYVNEVCLSFQFIDTFDKFTYDLSTGVYKCTDELTAFIYPDNEEEREEMKLFNTEVVIIDGKVFSIKSDYKLESDLGIASFEYFDIGTSVVIVPEGVIENLLEQ